MKAIEALKHINEIFPKYVALAKDENGEIYTHITEKIHPDNISLFWCGGYNGDPKGWILIGEKFANKIEWESDDWTKCIVTINDLQDELN